MRQPVPPTSHGYKYRAVYSVNGGRVVGFDNERGKGDHCHLDGGERAYRFTTVEALVEDFIAAVDTFKWGESGPYDVLIEDPH